MKIEDWKCDVCAREGQDGMHVSWYVISSYHLTQDDLVDVPNCELCGIRGGALKRCSSVDQVCY